jgi:hypothetical protein
MSSIAEASSCRLSQQLCTADTSTIHWIG